MGAAVNPPPEALRRRWVTHWSVRRLADCWPRIETSGQSRLDRSVVAAVVVCVDEKSQIQQNFRRSSLDGQRDLSRLPPTMFLG